MEDHVDALLLAACNGASGRSYCVGGHGERTNKEVVHSICQQLDQSRPGSAPHADLITPVTDRPGHDRRYAIDPGRIAPSWAGGLATMWNRAWRRLCTGT